MPRGSGSRRSRAAEPTARPGRTLCGAGRSAAWLARLLWEQKAGGSNPPVPIDVGDPRPRGPGAPSAFRARSRRRLRVGRLGLGGRLVGQRPRLPALLGEWALGCVDDLGCARGGRDAAQGRRRRAGRGRLRAARLLPRRRRARRPARARHDRRGDPLLGSRSASASRSASSRPRAEASESPPTAARRRPPTPSRSPRTRPRPASTPWP